MMECTKCGCWIDADGGDCQWLNDKPYCDNCHPGLLECCESSAREIRRAINNMLKSQKYEPGSIVIRSLEKAADDNEDAVLVAKGGES